MAEDSESTCEFAPRCWRRAYSLYAVNVGWEGGIPPDRLSLVLSEYASADMISDDPEERIYAINMPMPCGTNICPEMALQALSECEERIKELKRLQNKERSRERIQAYRERTGRKRVWIPKATRHMVAQRAHYRCQYCGKAQNSYDTEGQKVRCVVDHIVPLARGGNPEDPDNMALACRACNSEKGTQIWPLGHKLEL